MLLTPPALRATPRRVVLALMLACGILSGLVSNTATTVMLLPLAVLLAQRCGADERGQSAFALALAYSASIGGVSTLVGTFPNAVLAQVANEQVGIEVSFAKWSLVGVPFVLVALPVAWFIITRLMVPDSGEVPPPPEIPDWRPGEKAVLAVVTLAMVAWLTRRPVDLGFVRVPGWSEAAGFGAMVDDAWVAVLAGISLFLIPAGGRPLLSFREAERSLPWSVMFLLGGGFALAGMIGSSGLTEWLAGFTQHLAALPTPVAVLLLCFVVTFLTELTSNTATTQILLPLLAAGAMKAGTDPMIWMVPATISASCAFMMPVATPPNAIAAEGANVRPGDMATAGLLLNLCMVVVTTILMLGLVPLVFGE
jgi:sodium-dependent dicarboxylate transporter 2/3/5